MDSVEAATILTQTAIENGLIKVSFNSAKSLEDIYEINKKHAAEIAEFYNIIYQKVRSLK